VDTVTFLKSVKISDLIAEGEFKTKRELNAQFNLNLNEMIWTDLDKIRRAAVRRFGAVPDPGISLETFFATWKKGSKKVRNIICKERRRYISHNIVKFSSNIDLVINLDESVSLNKLWCLSYLSNSTRTFIFKLHNNTLGINTILSHFVAGIDRNCTFCNLIANPEMEDETVLHLFFTCSTVENKLEIFYKWLLGDPLFLINRRLFFYKF
jgi:hypothetical protein